MKQPAVSKHLSTIFRDGELEKDSVHSILEYTATVLSALSTRLTERYGKGWSVDILEQTRRLYITYSNSATPLRKLDSPTEISETLSRKSDYQPLIVYS